MTTPAALVPARPAAPATSSIEVAASFASVATSSSSATRPPAINPPRSFEPTQRAGAGEVAVAFKAEGKRIGRRSMRRLATVLASVGLIMGSAAFGQAQELSPAISSAVADTARPAADRARDALRKPAEIVAFAGVKPGDKIAEIAPGGGYYTRILSKAVGPQGKVYALMPAFFANRPGGLDAINALAE